MVRIDVKAVAVGIRLWPAAAKKQGMHCCIRCLTTFHAFLPFCFPTTLFSESVAILGLVVTARVTNCWCDGLIRAPSGIHLAGRSCKADCASSGNGCRPCTFLSSEDCRFPFRESWRLATIWPAFIACAQDSLHPWRGNVFKGKHEFAITNLPSRLRHTGQPHMQCLPS